MLICVCKIEKLKHFLDLFFLLLRAIGHTNHLIKTLFPTKNNLSNFINITYINTMCIRDLQVTNWLFLVTFDHLERQQYILSHLSHYLKLAQG